MNYIPTEITTRGSAPWVIAGKEPLLQEANKQDESYTCSGMSSQSNFKPFLLLCIDTSV